MNHKMNENMHSAWQELHTSRNHHATPSPSGTYTEGFTACHDLLMPLLIEAMPHVVGNQHWPDGKTAALVKCIEEVISNDNHRKSA